MRTILVTIAGTLTPGDLLMLNYSHKSGGGVSTIKYRVRPPVDEIVTDPATGAKTVQTLPDSIPNAIKGLLDELNRGQSWPNEEFQGSLKDDSTLVIKCKDDHEHAQNVFTAEVEGAKTETIELQVL